MLQTMFPDGELNQDTSSAALRAIAGPSPTRPTAMAEHTDLISLDLVVGPVGYPVMCMTLPFGTFRIAFDEGVVRQVSRHNRVNCPRCILISHCRTRLGDRRGNLATWRQRSCSARGFRTST